MGWLRGSVVQVGWSAAYLAPAAETVSVPSQNQPSFSKICVFFCHRENGFSPLSRTSDALPQGTLQTHGLVWQSNSGVQILLAKTGDEELKHKLLKAGWEHPCRSLSFLLPPQVYSTQSNCASKEAAWINTLQLIACLQLLAHLWMTCNIAWVIQITT